MNLQLKSTLILFVTAVIWGFAFVAQCVVDNSVIGNFTFNGLRFLLGSLSLIPVILIFERKSTTKKMLKKTFKVSLLAGAVLFIASALQQQGISMNRNAGKSGFITGLYIVLVPMFSQIIWKTKTSKNTWIAALLSICGLFLLSVGDGFGKIELGDLVVLIGSFFWAAHILILDKSVNGINPITFSSMQFAVCGVLNILFALPTETITISGIFATAYPILFTSIMSTGVGYTCQAIGQKNLSPSAASIILSTECLFSAVGGALFLGEALTAKGYIGCVLIFAGILLSQIKKAHS